MASVRISKHRVRSEELLALFGEEATTRLIRHCGGRRVPSNRQYLGVLRRIMVVHDWLHRGYNQPDLAAKYGIRLSCVKRIISRHLHQDHRRRHQHEG